MRRSLRLGLYVASGAATAALAYGGLVLRPKLLPTALVGTGYMARVACACHFIGHRPIDSCLADREGGMEQIRLSVDAARKQLTASVPMVASARAIYTAGLGCVIER